MGSINPFEEAASPPSWTYSVFDKPVATPRILMRVWDAYSWSQLHPKVDWHNSFVSFHGGFDTLHDPPQDIIGRRECLRSHATYESYKADGHCFISLTPSIGEARRHVERLHKRSDSIFISFVDSEKLPRQLGDWKLLRAVEQHTAYNVQRVDENGRPYGKDWWYKDEILAIRSIPEEAIIDTITLTEIRGWSGYPRDGFIGWANIEMHPRLKRELNLELNPFIGNLWDD